MELVYKDKYHKSRTRVQRDREFRFEFKAIEELIQLIKDFFNL